MRATVDYVADVSANDAHLVLSAFRPDAVMSGYLGGEAHQFGLTIRPQTENPPGDWILYA